MIEIRLSDDEAWDLEFEDAWSRMVIPDPPRRPRPICDPRGDAIVAGSPDPDLAGRRRRDPMADQTIRSLDRTSRLASACRALAGSRDEDGRGKGGPR